MFQVENGLTSGSRGDNDRERTDIRERMALCNFPRRKCDRQNFSADIHFSYFTAKWISLLLRLITARNNSISSFLQSHLRISSIATLFHLSNT